MANIAYIFKNFNNYYNRIIKKYDDINSYIQNSDDYAVRGDKSYINLESGSKMNFAIKDGVTSEMTYNYAADDLWQPDYVVITNELNEIQHRWFVLEADQPRKGQYVLSLRRDVIADNYTSTLNSPCFIERGYVPYTDNFIFNSEGIKFNQIKTDNEILLKDKTGISWIVGYVAAPEDNEANTVCEGKLDHDIDLYVSSIDNWMESHNANTTTYYYSPNSVYINWTVEGESLYNYAYRYEVNQFGTTADNISIGRHSNTYKWRENGSSSNVKSSLMSKVYNSNVSNYLQQANLRTIFNTPELYSNMSQYENFKALSNKIIKDTSTNKLYRVQVIAGEADNLNTTVGSSIANVHDVMNNIATSTFQAGHGNTEGYSLTVYGIKSLYLAVNEIATTNDIVTATITKNRRVLRDAPYCMFCIPYGKLELKNQSSSLSTFTDGDLGLAAARGIAESLTSAKCYDLQLLPYCPITDYKVWQDGNAILLDDLVENQDYTYVYLKDTSSGVTTAPSIILWAKQSNFTIDINVDLSIENTAEAFKIENETSMYRLCSPNYASAYEFNLAKNGGSVTKINVDCSYKPYQPYIHANIDFKRLYGSDTNDTRGLVCGGDFSLPQTSDQWSSYMLNNKNYQASFDKQIETNNNVFKVDQIANAVTGVASAFTTGVSAGSLGGPTAGLGAFTGSVGGATADLIKNDYVYNLQLGNTKAQFNYQLDNVKARPDTLGNVGAYNANNKIFLFIEHYKASDVEIEALKQNIKYRNMNIGRIGILEDYIEPNHNYIRGQLIRIENLSDDYHMGTEISNEISKGVYIE